tara:strand:+ start:187 stop:435 length:249 start_codon:yes stop_codon:yes gene_type:complete
MIPNSKKSGVLLIIMTEIKTTSLTKKSSESFQNILMKSLTVLILKRVSRSLILTGMGPLTSMNSADGGSQEGYLMVLLREIT